MDIYVSPKRQTYWHPEWEAYYVSYRKLRADGTPQGIHEKDTVIHFLESEPPADILDIMSPLTTLYPAKYGTPST